MRLRSSCLVDEISVMSFQVNWGYVTHAVQACHHEGQKRRVVQKALSIDGDGSWLQEGAVRNEACSQEIPESMDPMIVRKASSDAR